MFSDKVKATAERAGIKATQLARVYREARKYPVRVFHFTGDTERERFAVWCASLKRQHNAHDVYLFGGFVFLSHGETLVALYRVPSVIINFEKRGKRGKEKK